MTVDEIRERIKEMSVSAISLETRLSRQTLYNLRNDHQNKPTASTIKILTDHITLHDKREAAKARVRKS